MACPFCRVNTENTEVLAKREFVYVCLSNPRLVPGHTLVIPDRHVVSITELTDEEYKDFFHTIREFHDKIVHGSVASGCDIRINNRPFQKQDGLKINHLHAHLQPREYKDELYRRSQIYETELFRVLEDKEREKFKLLLGE